MKTMNTLNLLLFLQDSGGSLIGLLLPWAIIIGIFILIVLARQRKAQSVRTLGVEQSKQPNSKITIGIIILIIGVALIIISPSLIHTTAGLTEDLRDPAKFCGVALLIVGGIISAVGFSQFITTQPTPPPAPTTQPVVTQSVSPKSVELGNTPDEVQSVMGQPDKIINLGARVIHVYKDMKIIYVDGKVSDVQLS